MDESNHGGAVQGYDRAWGESGGGGDAQYVTSGECLFADEVAFGENGDCGFFAAIGDDCNFDAPVLDIEEGVSGRSLHTQYLLALEAVDVSSFTNFW